MSVSAAGSYPQGRADRNRWVLSHRGPKHALDPWRAYAALWEEEPDEHGCQVPTATVFLTNRECPYRCLMCDLWRNTLDTTVPAGAISAQIRRALAAMPADRPAPRQVKLYNAGSFFDPKAIPPQEHEAIAACVTGFERVIVECHPSLIRRPVLEFRDLLASTSGARLEVAIGLETADPLVLERLNKGITVASFRRAAAFLAENGIALRVFILVRPPFHSEEEGLEWACRSLDLAFECGASVACVIPTRAGNGAMEVLAAEGMYAPPGLRSLEAALEYGVALRRGRVLADLWDIEKFHDCACSQARTARMAAINRTQALPPPVCCDRCADPLKAL